MKFIPDRYEYRINKKGAECFRTEILEEAMEKFLQLSAKRPGVYSLQRRSCRRDRHGVLEISWNGENAWSPWFDCTPREASV